MKPKSIYTILCFLLFLANSCRHTVPPNFIFILVDDLGWSDLGCYGSSFYETPHIDQLAEDGIRFSEAYAASPVCSPTRASIMTGKYPARVGITDWIPGRDPGYRHLIPPEDLNQLPLEEYTLAEAFRDNGYLTFFAGKWHLGSEGFYPEDQGFDLNLGGYEAGHPYKGYYAPYGNPKLTDGPDGEYLTDRLTDEAIRFLSKAADTPYLLFLSYYTVHTPIQASRRHLAYFTEKRNYLPVSEQLPEFIRERAGWTRTTQNDPAYASMIYALDENIGRLLNAVRESGNWERTVIIFTSDNGGLATLSEQRAPTANLPLRAGKGWCYEGGIRVPLIIRAPGVTCQADSANFPVISQDLYPTMLQLAGLPSGPGQTGDCISLAPILTGGRAADRRTLFWHYPHYHGSTWTPGAAIREHDWKLIRFYEEERSELYNLSADPGERNDLSAQHPEKKAELENKLTAWQLQTGAKLPVRRPAH